MENFLYLVVIFMLQVSRAMELKGHTAGVYHFSFSADSTRYLKYLFTNTPNKNHHKLHCSTALALSHMEYL